MLGILSIIVFLPVLMAIPTYILGKIKPKLARIVCIGTTTALFGLTMLILVFYRYGSSAPGFQLVETMPWAPSFGLNYIVGLDGISLPLLIISTFLSLLACAGSWDLINFQEPEYYALFLIFETGIIGVFTSLNLILFYVFWEIVLIPMFFFIGVWGGPRRKYAALKFLLFTYSASAVMLFGFLAVFAYTHTFDYISVDGSPTLMSQVSQMPMFIQLFASVTTFIGFAVKLPIVPFHTWLPDAHVEAPAPVSVLLAGVLLKMGGYGFIRISLGLFPQASIQYAWAFMLVGVVTMFYGAIVATLAKDLKRMIALTSINHMGFVLLGAYSTASSGSPLGVQGAIFQMFNHALAIGSLFMLSGYIHEQAGTREIPLLKGLRISMPRTATLLMLSSLAAMGFPIYSSFVSEFMVIAASISAFSPYAVTVLVPALTGAYFMWMLRRTVLSAPTESVVVKDSSRLDSAALFAYLVPLFILLIFPSVILDPAAPVSQYILHLRGG